MKFNKKLVLPIVFTISFGLVTYYLPMIVYKPEDFFDISLPIDNLIPVIPAFIIIYYLAFAQWITTMLSLIKQDDETGYRFISALLICDIIGGICFLLFPATLTRPEIVPDNVFSKILLFVYSIDKPTSIFPSYHCAWSTLCVAIIYNYKDINKYKKFTCLIFSILVYLSTLFVKQHVVVDVIFGILVGIISILLSKKIVFRKLFKKLNNTILKVL